MRQRSTGSWELRVFAGVDPDTGRRRYRTATIRGNRADAERELDALYAELHRGGGMTGQPLSPGTIARVHRSSLVARCEPADTDSLSVEGMSGRAGSLRSLEYKLISERFWYPVAVAMLQSARLLPEWVLDLRSDRRANVALALDVAEAVIALGNRDVPPVVRKQLTAMIERAEQAGEGVPVSVAAKVLDVTEPTLRTWIKRGVLTAVEGSRPLTVTPRSLGEALAAAGQIRQVGEDERLLRRVLDALEDQRTRLELGDRIDELDSRVPIDADRIAEELFS